MAKPMDDEAKLKIMLAELASDSLRRKESKDQWVDRLKALRETIDMEIDAAKVG